MADILRVERFLAAVTVVVLAVWAGGCTLSQTADSSASGQAAAADVELRRQQAVSLYVDAMMLNDLNDYAGALQKLEEATALDNEFALAFSLKGDMYQAQQQYAQSADAYERAAQLDPWSFKDFFNLGKVSQILKQFERAVNAYVAASKLDPNHYESHIGAAKCYFELKDMAAAQQYAQKAKELDASQADPELLLGDILAEKKEHIEAIAAYRRALELQGNQPKIMVALARAYLRTGRFSSAKELLADVIVAEPDNAVAHQYMGFAQLKLKETEAAIESYKTAVKLNDNDWMAHKSLGVAYMLLAMQNSNDEKIKALAMEQWNISLQLNPDQPQLKELQSKYN